MTARVVVGLVVFVVLPGLLGLALTGSAWGFVAIPLAAVFAFAFLAGGMAVEFVFGGSPADYARREREGR